MMSKTNQCHDGPQTIRGKAVMYKAHAFPLQGSFQGINKRNAMDAKIIVALNADKKETPPGA